MLTLRFLGSTAHLTDALAAWPQIKPVGGHTDLLVDPADTASVELATAVWNSLVVEKKWTPLDTSTPTAPKRAKVLDLEATEMVIIPQIAGG